MGRTRQVGLGIVVVAMALLCLAPAAMSAKPPSRDLLIHGAGESLWLANVGRTKPDAGTAPGAGPTPDAGAGPAEQTRIVVRTNRLGQAWRDLAVLPGRVTALASRDSQLAVLLADGEWLTVWADGTATGQPLPANGRIRTLGDDGHVLWAVGLVHGGMAAADAALAAEVAPPTGSMPTTVTTTGPASRPGGPPDVDRSHGPNGRSVVTPAVVPRLVLFRQQVGRWATVAELPADVAVPAVDDLSFCVSPGGPTVAYMLADGSVRTLRWDKNHVWQDVGWVRPSGGGRVVNFQLLSDTPGPLLWLTEGTDAGDLQAETGGEDGAPPEPPARPLRWVGPAKLDGVPAAAVSGGYLRVIGPTGAKVFEQRYDAATGQPVGGPAEVVVPADLGDSPLVLWIQGLLLASLTFSVGTSVYRQMTPGRPADRSTAAGADAAGGVLPVPAPLSTRAVSGGIDASPVLIALIVAVVAASRPASDAVSAAVGWGLVGSVIVYLLHTTVVEAMTGRSAGKWVTGLRVVTAAGGRPARWQLVTRNLLRVLDPLVWIVLSPTRQRTADVLAGTMVVGPAVEPTPSSSGDRPQA